MRKFDRLVGIALLLSVSSIAGLAQQQQAAAPVSKGVALEVTYFKGRILAYQRIGQWTWYELFQRPDDWKVREGELPVAAVRISPRYEDGVVKVRISVLRGRNHETEDFVAQYTVSAEKKSVVDELTAVGVVPFELQLVRAPTTVADPPTVVNRTKSIDVSVAPSESTLPTFKVRFLNNSTKAVVAMAYHAAIEGVRRRTAAPRNEDGSPIIKPGEPYEFTMLYPMKVSPVSTGEVPPAMTGLVMNIETVIFADGTYEGDALPAANYFGLVAGQKTLLRAFLRVVQSKEFTNSQADFNAAINSVNVDGAIAEIVQRFTLNADQGKDVRAAFDVGRGSAVKLFRNNQSEPAAALAQLLQKRIDSLP
ncbi:MAG TPA: hypothetical protein VJV05_08775 [Pyrinomonadaceae bacterium]|nr:hypothetical protein [Pyrinomonadaceae bacterium]